MAVKSKESGKFKFVDAAAAADTSDECIIVLDKTIFYPESGGQTSDKGALVNTAHNVSMNIDNVFQIQNYVFHIGRISSEHANRSLNINEQIECQVDPERRHDTTINHSAVHLLNHAIVS